MPSNESIALQQEPGPAVRDDPITFNNVFERLYLDECDDLEETATSVGSPNAWKSSSTLLSEDSVSIEDQGIRILCFFDDLVELRQQVQQLLRDYVAGNSSLTATAMATNAAIALATRMEQDLFETLDLKTTLGKWLSHSLSSSSDQIRRIDVHRTRISTRRQEFESP